MTEKEIREHCSKDKRTLKELVLSLLERKAISPSVAKKFLGEKENGSIRN